MKQLIERKIVPVVTTYTITLSSKIKSSKDDTENGVYLDGVDESTQGLKVTGKPVSNN